MVRSGAGRKALRVLVAGESWTAHSIRIKGHDSFETTSYGRLRCNLANWLAGRL